MKSLESDYTTEFLFVSNKCFLLDSQKKKKENEQNVCEQVICYSDKWL